MNQQPSAEEQRQAAYIKRQAARIAQSLREAADEIEREVGRDVDRALTRDSSFGTATYATAASRAVSQLGWKWANFNLGQLVDAAGDADETRIEGK